MPARLPAQRTLFLSPQPAARPIAQCCAWPPSGCPQVHRSEGLIYMVLEFGDIDLARLLQVPGGGRAVWLDSR